jgi:outer membrane immunogenic protein
MIRNSLLICVAVVALTTGALASDLPTSKGPPPAPAYAPFSWTGFYIGANGGYGWGSAGDMTLSNNIGVSLPPTAGPKPAGGFGGAQAGYNWQTGMFVLGAEADIQGAAINNNFTRFLPAGGVNLNAKQDIDMFGTVRARGGFAVDHFLIYATGGLAYANVDDRLVLSAGGASATLTKNEIQVGAAVGGGWSMRSTRIGQSRANINMSGSLTAARFQGPLRRRTAVSSEAAPCKTVSRPCGPE